MATSISWVIFSLLLSLLSTQLDTQHYYYTDDFIEILMYSRGKLQDFINDESRSFIKLNGTEILASGRGLGLVVIDENNGTVIDALTFDVYQNGDTEMAQYLNEIKTNRIIGIVGFDEPSSSDSVISILNTWGCSDVSDIAYRESFIFIGTKNTVNISNFTYCEKSTLYDSAIWKTFEIPINIQNIYNLPYRMIQMNRSYICNPLTDNLYVVHDIHYETCEAKCIRNDECVMINYIPYSKTSSDARCYLFNKECDLIHGAYGNIVAIKGFNEICINYPFDWVDTYDDDCDYYDRYRWCYDHSINDDINVASFIQHSDAVYGLNAIQTCCICGGGLYVFDDTKIEFTVSLDGMLSFYNNTDTILCEWNLGNPNQYSYYNGHWTNVHLFDLCTKLKQRADHQFTVIYNKMSLYNQINSCDVFIDPTSNTTNMEIIVCDFDSYDFDHRTEHYFIAIFDVNVNETSVYINTHWFNYSQLLTFSNKNIKPQTHKQCLASLLQSSQSTLHAIYPCDIFTPSPTFTPTSYPTPTITECSYFNEGPITTQANYKLTTLTVGQNVIIEFDFIINTGCDDDVCNLIHIGVADGIRMPGIWVRNDGDFVIRFSNNEEWNSGFVVTPTMDTSDNEVHHMLIIYTQMKRLLFIDDEEHYAEEGDFTNTEYHNIYPLYVSDPWYPALDSIISNLCIIIKTDTTESTQAVDDILDASDLDHDHNHSAITALIVVVIVLLVAFIIIIVILYNMNENMSMNASRQQNANNDSIYNTRSKSQRIKQMETEMVALRSMINEVQNAPPAYVPSTNDHQCILCVDKVANMFNYPCGHVSYCSKCSSIAFQQDNKCPNCREPVLECKAIYSGGFVPFDKH